MSIVSGFPPRFPRRRRERGKGHACAPRPLRARQPAVHVARFAPLRRESTGGDSLE